MGLKTERAMKNIFDLVIRFMAISAMLVGMSLAMVATAPESVATAAAAAATEGLVAEDAVVVNQAQLNIAQKFDQNIRNISDINELVDILYDFLASSQIGKKYQRTSWGVLGERSDYGVRKPYAFDYYYMADWNAGKVYRLDKSMSNSEHVYWFELALWRDILGSFITGGGGGDIDAIKRFAVVGVNVNSTDMLGNTALHFAVNNMIGFDPVPIQYLIDIGADPTIRNKDGITPLMLLVRGTTRSGIVHFPIAEVLVEAGANPNVQNFAGETLLHFATQENKPEMVRKFLLAGANSNIGNKVSGETPLMHATKKGFVDVAKLLFGGGANVHIKDKGGRTALDYAKRIGHVELVSLLQEAESASKSELVELRKKALFAPKKKSKSKSDNNILCGIVGCD